MLRPWQHFLASLVDITERKQAESQKEAALAALRQSEQLYHQMFAEHSAVKLLIDPLTSAIVQANPAAAEFYGYPLAVLQTMRLDQINILPRAQILEAMNRARLRRGNFFVFQHRLASGDVRDVEVHSTPLQVGGRELLYSIIHDITARQQVERQRQVALAALRASEEKYHSVVAALAEGIVLLDVHGVIQASNANAAQILGLSADQIMGRTPVDSRWQAIHEDGSPFPGETHPVMETLRTGQSHSNVVMGVRKPDDTLTWISINSQSIQPRGAAAPQAVVASVTDITERKRTENIIQARLRIIDYAIVHTLDELLQYALDELCALTESPIGFFHFVEPDQRTLSLQAWSTRTLQDMCTAEGKGHTYDIDQAGVWVECVRQGGPVIHNDYASLPQRKGLPQGHAPVTREMVFPIQRDQQIVAIIGVGNKTQAYTDNDVAYASRLADLIWDITARKQAEEALRDLNNQLEQRVADRTHELAETNARLIELGQFKDQFIDRISHELRSPLFNVKLHFDLLLKDKPEKRDGHEQVVREKITELEQKIKDLVDVSYLNLDLFDLHLQPVDVNAVLHELLAERTALALKRRLTVQPSLASDLPAAQADRILLRQALMNVLANALNYTPIGGQVTLRTGRHTTTDGEWVAIEVHDTGPGLSEKDQAHLFEPFYRGEAARDYKIPGTGVGLFIARRAVEKMQGHLTVESTPGQGAAFTVWIRP